MKRFFTILFSLCLITGCATQIDRPIMDLDYYLYEVKDDNNNTLYILGTIDLGPTFEAKEGKFQEVYEKCDTIVFETIQDYTDEQQKQYDEFNQEVTMKVVGEQLIEPFFNSFAIYRGMEETIIYNRNIYEFYMSMIRTIGNPKLQSVSGVTSVVNTMAILDQKKINSLMSFEETIDLYTKLNNECYNFIFATLINAANIKNDMYALVEAYAGGTVEKIAERTTFDLLNLDISFVPEEYQTDEVKAQFEVYKQYKQQNIPNEKINQLLALNNALLVYDVCVLERENGLIDQLKASGYQVTNLHE